MLISEIRALMEEQSRASSGDRIEITTTHPETDGECWRNKLGRLYHSREMTPADTYV
ncbi:hypothetical protein DY000_02008668 [Brassica cretica]|uniref:Uncharacterized protein n=1 Tax=Brassica cretica TaxID=69181 RepID=A0ABQ7CAL1_BRACR|nr:hypothetical protein DY000_02008668 [Brassica cretica]